MGKTKTISGAVQAQRKKNPPPNYRLRDNSTGGTTPRPMIGRGKLSHTQIAECGWDCQLAVGYSGLWCPCLHPPLDMVVQIHRILSQPLTIQGDGHTE